MSKENQNFSFPPQMSLAVAIMSSISCLTTAEGIEPMVRVKLVAFAFAIAASLFMVIIAIQYAKADNWRTRRMAFAGYTMVAIISILFNFNAIYGTFNKDNLLYDEINEKRDQLVKLRTTATKDIKDKYEVSLYEGKLEEAKGRAKGEDGTPGDQGKGAKYQKIWREEVIPAEGKFDRAMSKAKPHLTVIEDRIGSIYPDAINQAVASENPKVIRAAITNTIAIYNEISNDIGSITEKEYGNLTFDEKNVGSMNNAIKQLVSFGSKNAEDKAGVITSLFLSIIIDFIIIFVVIFYAPEINDRRRRRKGSSKPTPIWGKSGNSGGIIQDRK